MSLSLLVVLGAIPVAIGSLANLAILCVYVNKLTGKYDY